MVSAFDLYGFAAIVFYFFVYSFLGWVLENSYSLATTRKFFKEGFFRGPFKPMHGFAPVLLVWFIGPSTHWSIILLLCLIIPTTVEYVSGFLLYTFFHRRWWDYSKIPMQLQGHICLSFSACWVFLSVICVKWIHPLLTSGYEFIDSYWIWLSPIIMLYFFAELFFSIRRHSPQRSSVSKEPNTSQ
ncbi:putative ABC transporter permease [Bacillus sp. FJAT-49705]|uniref:ABC transporter permease n=1 Tax=Cytobacillus citreus TaxID=2833586 RepID=A0ABS5NYV4_9BACI|nr:putative ABC transporter permease [Cytobacillus citreus]MBS4193030.1 putative ABC transporter permease [Cytobacillus citreus]